jgi:hypothetical protein
MSWQAVFPSRGSMSAIQASKSTLFSLQVTARLFMIAEVSPAGLIAHKKPVLAAKRPWPNGLLGRIVVDAHRWIGKKHREFFLLVQ